MSRRKAALAVAAAALLLALGAAGGYLYWSANVALHPGDEVYELAPGASARTLARGLYRRGVLPDPYTLEIWATLRGDARRLKAGEYRFADGITLHGVLDQITRGDVVSYSVTIVEGWTFAQMLDALHAVPRLAPTLQGLDAAQIMARLGRANEHPEGRFLPETYRYIAGTRDLDVLARAYSHMERVLAEEWARRDPELPLGSPYEALILASIIEKETALPAERGTIAGVFVNRLRRGMRLQTDPTVIYGLGETFDGDLRSRDLRSDTPYNTYTRDGLPPTPIALPGRAAIRAALHPAPTEALYFVSRGDGSHVFSRTLSEHDAAVDKYQLRGRRRPSAAGSPDAGNGAAAGGEGA